MIKLVVSDIDGTLVKDGHHVLNPRMNELILALKEKGIIFVAASGRQYPSMRRLFKDVKDEVIFVAENGAYVMCRDFEINEHIMDNALVKELIKDIREVGDCLLTVSTKDILYLEERDEDFLNLLINGYKYEVDVVDDISSHDINPIKVSIYRKNGVDEIAKTIAPKWEDKLKVTISGGRWLDFMDSTVDKGEAVERIQELLRIGIDETMIFGDNMNDLGMFKRATESYAVANARAEVKAAAKHIADSNINDGVIKVLETLV